MMDNNLGRGMVQRVRVNGQTLNLDADEVVTNFEGSLSTSETAQFTITMLDKDDHILLTRRLGVSLPFEIAGVTDLPSLQLIVTAEESSFGVGGPSLKVTARARGIERLKQRHGPLTMENATASEFVLRMCEEVGLEHLIQKTGERKAVGIDASQPGKTPITAWDAIKGYAQENGYIVFESANKLFFGKPTFLAERMPSIVLDLRAFTDNGGYDEVLSKRPTCRRSSDDVGVPITVQFECTANYAEQFRPGKCVTLANMPVFSGRYMITSCNWSADGRGTVTAQTPIDPEPPDRPATEAERMGLAPGSTGGPGQAAATGASGAITMDDYLYGLRLHESNNNYQAKSPISSASGAYQYIDSTWARYMGYATARSAPPSVQDQRVRQDSQAAYTRYNGDWEKVAAHHFYPKWANDKSQWGKSPSPGNPTVRAYVDSVIGKARAKAGTRAPAAASGSDGGTPNGASGYDWPTTSRRTTSEFGMRRHPITGQNQLHAGLDIGVGTGTPVFAAKAGKVVTAGVMGGYGNIVILQHGANDFTRYGHLSKFHVTVGQQVGQGQRIADSGATGGVTGAHLHFEVRPGNTPQNPRNYLPK